MRFQEPTFLYVAGAALVVLAIAYALDFTRRRKLLERIGHAPQLQRMTSSVSPARRAVKAILVVVGVTLILASLARPQVRGETLWKQRGIDLVFVIDFSKSMLARDVYPTRIDRARLEVDSLIDRLSGDRVGIVAFGGEAAHYPLTTDYEAAKLLYHGLDPRDLAPGSDIGTGIRAARCLLDVGGRLDPDCAILRGDGGGGAPLDADDEAPRRRLEAAEVGDRGRAIVLFTDGEDTQGEARGEVERAARLGIQLYVVGIGTPGGARVPEFGEDGVLVDWKRGPDGEYVTTRLREDALRELAKAGGGEDRLHVADPRRIHVEGIVRALGTLKEGNLEERTVEVPREAFQWFLFPGFLALLIEACLSDRRRPRARERVTA